MERHCAQFLRTVLIGLAIACLILIWNPLPIQAELVAKISVDISGNPGGGFLYEYLIVNSPDSTMAINAYVLDVGPDADLQNIKGPAGWFGEYDPAEDPFEMAWVSLSPQGDLPIGGQGTFSFTSPLAAEPLQYYYANLAPDGSELGGILGYIDAPSIPIPEPATSMLFILILALVAPGWRRIR